MGDRPANPLTPEQEAHWRAAIAADRWGSGKEWSSQSVASLFATLDVARAALREIEDGTTPDRIGKYEYLRDWINAKARAVLSGETCRFVSVPSPGSGLHCETHGAGEIDVAVTRCRRAVLSGETRTDRGLDVHLLGLALNNTVGASGWLRLTPSDAVSEWVENASLIAAEYDRLIREEVNGTSPVGSQPTP